MDIVVSLLIFLHFMGLVIGMGSGIAMGVLGPMYGQASEEQRGLLFRIGKLLGRNGHIGLALLWITGPLIIFLKYGGLGAMTDFFWIKIVFVVILSASIGIGSAAFRRWANGDMSASGRVALTSKINGACGILAVLFAVLAFG